MSSKFVSLEKKHDSYDKLHGETATHIKPIISGYVNLAKLETVETHICTLSLCMSTIYNTYRQFSMDYIITVKNKL